MQPNQMPTKPKDLLLKQLKVYYLPFMEPLGFRFAKSNLRLSRKYDEVTQIIQFSLDEYNSANECTFWTMWSTQSTQYGKWYEQTWGRKPPNIALGGISDWNITVWSRGVAEHFHLNGTKSDSQEIACLIENTQAHGLPFLQRISDYKTAAECLVEERWMYDKTTDLLMTAGDEARAREVLLQGIDEFANNDRVDNFGELSELQSRNQKYFGVATAKH